tara:strand:- start:12665 stop:13843 length:1179 start_codon:yes stop_codon:yes gene_type:complete
MKVSKFLTFLILFTSPLSGVAIDIFVPSLPAVQSYFHTSVAQVQLLVSGYVFVAGFIQLIWGTLSDSWGRKHLLLIAAALFTLASVLAPQMTSIQGLLAMRVLQGLGAGGTAVIARAMMPAYYSGKQLKVMTTYYTTAWAIGPIVAPYFGGYLQHYFGWQATFYALAIYSSAVFVFVLFGLREASQQRHPLELRHILNIYKAVILNPVFLGTGIALGLAFGLVTVFNVMGPFLLQNLLHFTPVQYGRIALIMGATWFLGNICNRYYIQYMSQRKIMLLSITIGLGFSILMLVFAMMGLFNVWVIVVPAALAYYFVAIYFPNGYAVTLTMFPEHAGKVSALMGALVISVSGLTSMLASFVTFHNQLPLAMGFVLVTLASLILFVLLVRRGLPA